MPDHDPTGLDLAHQIAARARGARANPNAKPAKRRRLGDPEPVGDILGDVVAEQGWQTQLGIHQLLANWAGLVGPVNADHSKPETYRDQVLTIRAESTAWATSLRMIAPQIVATLNAKLGQGSVERVVVVGPEAPSWKRGKRTVPGRGPRDTYG
ncbi:MAG: DciA family protein [Propionibacteriaceae bacterium]|jgi:predicted nucleic acid-binding Zn ribbon protein|nr:DciA family protein [Propionibacteriaceae bacterium]